MRKLFWFLVVVLVLAVVVDRGADYAAEQVVASNLQTEAKLSQQPDVSIAGFPFLTQFANSRYAKVTASAHDVPVGEGNATTTLSRVAFTFRNVTTNRDFSRFTARSGSARATLSYAALSKLLDVQVRYAGNGKVKASKKFTVLGATINPAITVEPSFVGGALRFTNASLAADVPSQVADALRNVFDLVVPLSNLPLNTRVKSLSADGGGIRLVLSGQDLTYRISS